MPPSVTIDQSALNAVLGRLIDQWLPKRTEDVAVEARARAPRSDKDGPHLADNIITRVEGSGVTAKGVIVANVPHALSVHNGTRPHPIEGRNSPRRVLRFPDSGGAIIFRRRVDHRGTQPQPFLRNALIDVMSR